MPSPYTLQFHYDLLILLIMIIFRNVTHVAGSVLFCVITNGIDSASKGGKYCDPH